MEKKSNFGQQNPDLDRSKGTQPYMRTGGVKNYMKEDHRSYRRNFCTVRVNGRIQHPT